MSKTKSAMTVSGEYKVGQIDLILADECSKYYAKPYEWVLFAFEWGHGELEGFEGPDEWQKETLIDIGKQVLERGFDGVTPVDPIREATASGHGIGKSALTAWLILWIMSTRPYAKGIVTANTSDQLRTKTWGELGKWRSRCIVGHWFEYNNGRGSMSLYHHSWPESWRVDAQTCREENSEAFAGLHSANSTPFYLFDEACHDDITEVMTATGWKLFKDLTPDDQLLTKDPDTHEADYMKPVALHQSHRDDVMYEYEQRGASFSVTPNHKMHFRKANRKQGGFYPWRFDEMQNIKAEAYLSRDIKWTQGDVDTFTVPRFKSARKSYDSKVVDFSDWCEFLGWYCSEGSTDKYKPVNGGIDFTAVRITQNDLSPIINVVERLGYKYSIYNSSTPQLCIIDRALAEYLGSHGKNCLEKRLPDEVRFGSVKQINMFLDAYIQGDGYHKTPNRDILYTSSKLLADGLQELCLKSGAMSSVTVRPLEGVVSNLGTHTATSSCDGYVVSRSKKPSHLNVRVNNIKKIEYSGMVYCAELPRHHLLFTRRKGYCMWSGNSAVPDKIWEVAEGGLTDGEPMFFVFGNPTRNTGKFRECFNRSKHRWMTRQIDSRTAKMTNKKLINQWKDDWGEDSDFFRVRVLGRFPRAGDTQFIPSDIVFDAQKRGAGRYMGDDPLICGIDVARGGDDNCMISFRRGKDAKSEKTYRIPGEKSRNSMHVISKLTMLLDRHKPDNVFLDETGIGGPMVDRLNQLGYNVVGVNFGGKADDEKHYANKTAEMGARMRQWLMDGGSIPDEPQLEEELTSRDYWHDDKDRLVLEKKKDMKKRIHCSPDWADSLYLTFAYMVPKLDYERGMLDAAVGLRDQNSSDYNPLDNLGDVQY